MPGSSSPSDQSAPTTPLDALALHPIYLPDLLDTLHQHQQQPAVYYPQPHLQPQPQQQYLSGGSDPVIYRRESHNAYAGRVVQQQLSPRDHNYFLSNSARREGRSAGPFPNQQSRDGLATSASASLTPVAGASSTATVPPPPQSSNNVQDNANTQANSNHMQHNWNNVQHNNSNNTDMQYSGTNAQQNNSNDGNAQYNGNNAPYNNSTQYGSYSNNNALNSANTQNSTSNVQQNSNNNAPAPPPHPLSGEAIDATTDVHPGLALPSPFSQAHGGGGEVPDISLTALPAPEELPSCVSGEVADRRASHLPFHHRNTITSSNASTPAPAVDGGGSTTSAPGTAHPLGVSSPSSTPTESAHTTTNNVMHVNVPRGPTSASPLQHTGSTDPQSETTHTDAPLLTAENTAASMATVGGGGGQSMSPRERQNTASPPPLMLSSPRTLSPNPQQPSTTTTTTTTNNLTREKKDVKDDGRASPPTTSAGPDGGEVLHVLPYNYSARRGGDHTPISVSPNRLLLHEGTPLRPTFSTEMIDFHAESPPHHMATQDVQGILHPSGRNSPALRSPTLRDEDRRNTINTNSSSSPNNTNSDGTPTSLRGGGRNFDLDVKRRYSRHFQPGQSTTSDYGAEATMAEDSSARYSPSFMNGVHSRHEFVQLSNAIIQPQYLRPQQEAEDGTGEATGNDAVGARQEAVMEEDEPNRAKDFFTPSPSPHADHPSPTGSPQSPQLVDDATPPSSSPTPTPTPATQATPTIDSEHVPVIDLRMLRSAALSPNISEGGWADASAHHHDHHQAEMVDVAPLCLPLRAEEVCEPRPKTAVLFTSLQSYLEHAAKEHPSPSIVDASNNNNNNHDEANNTQARTLDASVHPQQHTQEMKTQRMLLMDDEPLVAVRESARSHVDATRMSTMASMHDDLVGSPLAEDATYFPHVHDENGVQRSKHKVPSSSTARATAEWVAHGFTTQQQPKNKDVDDGVSSRHEHDGTPLNSSSTTPAPTTSSPLLSPSNQSSPQPSRMDETSPLHNTKLLAPHPPPRPAGQTSSSSQSNIITTPCVVHHAKKRSSQHPHQQEQQQQQQHDVGSSSRRQSSSNRRDDDVRARQHDSVAVAPPPPHASPNYGPLYAVSLWQPPSSSTNSSGTSRDETPAMTHNAAVVHHHDAAPPHAAHSGLVGDPVHHGQQGTRRRHTRGGHCHPFMPLPPLHDERSGMRPFWIHHPSNRGDDGPWKLVPLPKRYARAAW